MDPDGRCGPILVSGVGGPTVIVGESRDVETNPVLGLRCFFGVVTVVSMPPLRLPVLGGVTRPETKDTVTGRDSDVN